MSFPIPLKTALFGAYSRLLITVAAFLQARFSGIQCYRRAWTLDWWRPAMENKAFVFSCQGNLKSLAYRNPRSWDGLRTLGMPPRPAFIVLMRRNEHRCPPSLNSWGTIIQIQSCWRSFRLSFTTRKRKIRFIKVDCGFYGGCALEFEPHLPLC